jgi:Holliday junction resolvase
MSGGRSPRQKGNRAERALVKYLQDRGLAAERVPLSGSAGGRYCGDLTIPILGIDRCCEVKVRGAGFAQLYTWLTDRDLLIVRADRSPPLVIIPLELAVEIAIAAEKRK